MAIAPYVSDEVWARLDPHAGRLTRRGRRSLMAVVAIAVLAPGLAVLAGVTGAVDPRFSGTVYEARVEPHRATIALRIRIDNAGATTLHVEAMTTDESRYDIDPAPSPFPVPGHGSQTVRVVVHVRSCVGVTRADLIPVGIVLGHWWGEREHTLLTTDRLVPGSVARACRGR